MWNSLFGLKSPASFERCQSLSGKGRCHILGPLADILSAPSLNILECRACEASSLATGSNSPLGDDQLTAQSLSSPMCPEHMTTGLIIRLQKVIIDLHNRASWCHVHLWKPLCSNMVFVVDMLWFAQKSSNKTPFGFESRRSRSHCCCLHEH